MPIIMLTAKSDDMDKIMGLEYGADDYITKPFNILELKARIKAILRRNNRSHRKEEEKDTRIHVRDLTMDTESRRVFLGDREVNLTAKEFDLLELILTNPGKVYSREQLLNLVWGFEYPGDVRTVDVHVRRLRVSFSWITTAVPNFSGAEPGVRKYRRSRSCKDALHKKYCCRSRSRLPSSFVSFGYSTRVRFSAAVRRVTAAV